MKKKKQDLLEVVAISLTNRCNLSCSHCGYDFLNRDKRKELPISFFVNVLKEAKGLGAHAVNITGGEIFLRKDCLDLIESAVKMGYFATLESNGTLITDSDIKRLKSLGKSIRIAISFDGITPDVHEKIRGKGTFKLTKTLLQKISKEGIPARVNTVLQNGNIKEVPDIANFAVNDLGLGFRLLPFILEYGKGACACKTDGVPYAEIEKLMDGFFYPFMREKGQLVNITIGLKMALVPIDIEGHMICPWGKSMIGVGPSGIASLCHVTNNNESFIFSDLKKESLTKIWEENEILERFRKFNPDTLKGVCGNCLAREVCRGGCRLNAFSSYGDFLAPDSQCQVVYNMGKFPEYALENLDKDCRFVLSSI